VKERGRNEQVQRNRKRMQEGPYVRAEVEVAK